MSFDHIIPVATGVTLPREERVVWIYDVQGREKCYTGFTSTRELIAWMNTPSAQVEAACIGGEWEVDDAGSKYDFDGDELYPWVTWEQFKREHAENMREVEADNRRWREEIAREEGMLNGIDSYNDWMGY